MQEAQNTKRISIERCRELLGDDEKQLTDQQVGELRDALYTLSENVLDSIFMNLTVDHDHE